MELIIEKLVHRGAGLGRIDGRVCLVPRTAPGDRVRARIVRERPGWIEGELDELLSPGPDRVAPRCPVFGRCGGCQWQHLDAARQPFLKADILADTVRRLGHVELPAPAVVSGPPWGWRGRIELHASPSGQLGFFEAGSHRIVDCADCPIALPRLSSLIPPLRERVARHPPAGSTTVEPVAGADGSIVVVVRGCGSGLPVLAAQVRELPGVSGVILGVAQRAGTRWTTSGQVRVPWTVPGPEGPLTLQLDSRGFSQANPGLNTALVNAVVSAIGPEAPGQVLELYAGAGNLTVPMAARGLNVTAVEVNGPALADGRAAVRALGRSARFLPGRVEDVVRSLDRQRFDVVVADPPRTGLGPVAAALVALAPRRLVLVSCEPSTLARDLRVLTDGGFAVQAATVIDMFPQTWHIESVLTLTRGDPRDGPGRPDAGPVV